MARYNPLVWVHEFRTELDLLWERLGKLEHKGEEFLAVEEDGSVPADSTLPSKPTKPSKVPKEFEVPEQEKK